MLANINVLQVSHHGKTRRIPRRFGGYRNQRAGLMLTLLLPGTTHVYYGEEIGMDNIQVKYDDIQSLSAKNNPVCIKKCPNLSWILFNDNVFLLVRISIISS